MNLADFYFAITLENALKRIQEVVFYSTRQNYSTFTKKLHQRRTLHNYIIDNVRCYVGDIE